MRIFHNTTSLPDDAAGAALAIGNFDGVHRGHLEVLEQARAIAERENKLFGVLTFDPHPRSFFRPDEPHFCLTPVDLKARLLQALGLDIMVIAPFNAKLAQMTARDFAQTVLKQNLKAGHVVTGQNFYFGKGREGNAATLAALGKDLGFGVGLVEPQTFQSGGGDETAFSSTGVRQHLAEGRPEEAAEILGHWWSILGTIVKGDQRGREIGFPTANIKLDPDVKPKFGVYAVRARLIGGDGQLLETCPGVANLGLRPTFARDHPVLEVHLFDFQDDIYDRDIMVELISFLRPEQQFSDFEALKAQIASDAKSAYSMLTQMEQTGDPMARFPIGKVFAGSAGKE